MHALDVFGFLPYLQGRMCIRKGRVLIINFLCQLNANDKLKHWNGKKLIKKNITFSEEIKNENQLGSPFFFITTIIIIIETHNIETGNKTSFVKKKTSRSSCDGRKIKWHNQVFKRHRHRRRPTNVTFYVAVLLLS